MDFAGDADWSRIYVHEQKHIVEVNKAASKLGFALAAEQYELEVHNAEDCPKTRKRASDLQETYMSRLQRWMQRAGNHSDEPTNANPNGPAADEGIDPLPGSPPLPDPEAQREGTTR